MPVATTTPQLSMAEKMRKIEEFCARERKRLDKTGPQQWTNMDHKIHFVVECAQLLSDPYPHRELGVTYTLYSRITSHCPHKDDRTLDAIEVVETKVRLRAWDGAECECYG